MSKRENYISWDDYFMGLALLSSLRSKDPSSQVGACIVDSKTNRILSVGYNGLPKHCSDDEYPWIKEGEALETKYPYVVHAELNAILNNRGVSLEGSKLYTTLFPCNECAKAIIQSGIKEVVYLSDKHHESSEVKASKKMLTSAGISFNQFIADIDKIELKFRDN
ncbi:MAG: dCMP deaminase family protein [Bacillota bacterium]|jgi:dCMP deaminase|nr:dCMP deaminase family protein [Bacillota bacterium]